MFNITRRRIGSRLVTSSFPTQRNATKNSVPFFNQSLLFSTSSDDENTSTKVEKLPFKFPWRENALEPLPRIIDQDDLSGVQHTGRAKFFRRMIAGVELQTGLWDLFITKNWETELAQNSEYAFKMAVAGLLSKTFNVPLTQIDIADDYIKFDSTMVSSGQDTTVTEAEKNEDETNLENNEDVDNHDESTDEEEIDTDAFLSSMVEESLLNLYTESVDNDADKEVYFYMKPTASRVENLFIVPGLTRSDTKEDESLRGAYTRVEKEYNDTQDMRRVSELAGEMIQKVSHNGTHRAIIMDVSIDCIEKFLVKVGDKVLQGDDEEKETTHVVRLEMETSKGDQPKERILGSWYITDIDDQLAGNVWH